MSAFLSVSLSIFLLIVSCLPVFSQEQPAPPAASPPQPASRSIKEFLYGSVEMGPVELGWEADLYYSNISLNIPLTSTPIPKIDDADELDIYSRLFVNSLLPRFMVLEAAVMPMPLAGVAIREYGENFYDKAKVGKNQNVISWITAGFEEPWAASLFVGDMVRFHKQGADRLSSKKG